MLHSGRILLSSFCLVRPVTIQDKMDCYAKRNFLTALHGYELDAQYLAEDRRVY